MADWTKTRGRALSGRGVEYEGSERGLGGGREGGGGDVGKEVIMEEGFSPLRRDVNLGLCVDRVESGYYRMPSTLTAGH